MEHNAPPHTPSRSPHRQEANQVKIGVEMYVNSLIFGGKPAVAG